MKNKREFYIYKCIFVVALVISLWTCDDKDEEKLPSVATSEVSQITQTTAMSGGEIISRGSSNITFCGVCWSTNQNPTINDHKTEDLPDGESFTSIISGLDTNTTYFVRAYATNTVGTGYGKIIKFTTLEEIGIPNLNTIEITEISRTSISSGGNIISYGGSPIINCGVVWSTMENLTVDENTGMTIDNIEDSTFSSVIESLIPRQTYYIRAYATNSEGTGYGDVLAFTTSGSWLRRADFKGSARFAAVSFTISDKGYVGTGLEMKETDFKFKQDIWQFDNNENTWSKMIGLGSKRANAIAFSINDKGYIGLGFYVGIFYYDYKDLWSYNPGDFRWTELADIGNSDYTGFGFSINDKGYAGYASYWNNNFWQYDPVKNIWSQKSRFPGLYPNGSACFTVGDKAYVCVGYNPSGVSFGNELWEYDPSTDSWNRKADFPGSPRGGAVGFSIENKGYVGTGWDGTDYFNDFWEYDPSTDTWKQVEDFKGVARGNAVAFTIGNKGYVGTGITGDYDELKDFWEFDPEIK